MKICTYMMVLLVVIGSATISLASTWTSPDGSMSFDLPDDGSYREEKNPIAPVKGVWIGHNNGGGMIVVTEIPLPGGVDHLYQKDLEISALKEIRNSKLDSSTVSMVNGREIYTIDLSDKANAAAFYQQKIAWVGNKCCKIFVSSNVPISSNTGLSSLLQSLKFTGPVPALTETEAVHSGFWQRSGGGVWGSAIIGGVVGGLCGAIAVIYKMCRKPKSPPLPPPMPPTPGL